MLYYRNRRDMSIKRQAWSDLLSPQFQHEDRTRAMNEVMGMCVQRASAAIPMPCFFLAFYHIIYKQYHRFQSKSDIV